MNKKTTLFLIYVLIIFCFLSVVVVAANKFFFHIGRQVDYFCKDWVSEIAQCVSKNWDIKCLMNIKDLDSIDDNKKNEMSESLKACADKMGTFKKYLGCEGGTRTCFFEKNHFYYFVSKYTATIECQKGIARIYMVIERRDKKWHLEKLSAEIKP
jgi:hypothetical protein